MTTTVIERVWFDTKSAADYLGLSEDWVRELAQAGELRGHQRVKGGRWRFHRDWLDAYMTGEAPHLRAA